MKPENNGKSKVFSVIGFALSAVFFALSATIFILALQAKKQNKPLTIFGYFTSIVQTGSMEPELKVGDMIIVKTATIDNAKEGDDVVFISNDPSIKGERVVHRVIEVGKDENGIFLTTKGINNPTEDSDKVRAGNFVGIAVAHNTFFGRLLSFFTHTENIILVVVLLVLVPFIVKQIKKIIVLSKGLPDKSIENGETEISESELAVKEEQRLDEIPESAETEQTDSADKE